MLTDSRCKDLNCLPMYKEAKEKHIQTDRSYKDANCLQMYKEDKETTYSNRQQIQGTQLLAIVQRRER